MKPLIKKLVETTAPSGYEGPIRDIVRSEIEPYAEEIRVDALGNLICRKGQGGKKIMLSAHMDEIGFIISHIDENGFLRFIPIGGVRPVTLIGGRVRFLNGQSGIIHGERQEDLYKVPPIEQLYIDVGASNKEEAGVRVGDVGAFDRPFQEMGNRIVAKAMDDRVSVAILIETLRRVSGDNPPLHEISFVFSVQEEVGVRGATTAAFGLDPDIGLAVDVTGTGDTPKGFKMEVKLGEGPAVKVRDGGMLADPRIVDWMVQTAEAAGIPYQMEILERGSTDARAMQLSRAGVPAGCLSIPCRYIHSPSEMVDMKDVENAVSLLVELVTNPIQLSY
jgi:tetrahedral aminopeptidase